MPSSVVAAATYDAAKKNLRVHFLSGSVYDYKKVPGKIFDAMKAAASKGTFLNRYIKGKYEFKKVR